MEKIGEGSFSIVFRKGDKAVKQIIDFKHFFNTEVEILKKLDHINIVKMYSYNPRLLQIEIELCECAFSEVKHTNKFIYFIDILHGLHYLYSKGISHNDLDPHNILFKFGILKICDFGLSGFNLENTKDIKDLSFIIFWMYIKDVHFRIESPEIKYHPYKSLVEYIYNENPSTLSIFNFIDTLF